MIKELFHESPNNYSNNLDIVTVEANNIEEVIAAGYYLNPFCTKEKISNDTYEFYCFKGRYADFVEFCKRGLESYAVQQASRTMHIDFQNCTEEEWEAYEALKEEIINNFKPLYL